VKKSKLSSKTAPAPQADGPFLFDPHRVWVMGVLNLTPDSFFAGSRSLDVSFSLIRARLMLEEGADVLDLGAESTRPGSLEVPVAEELDRLLPVLEAIRENHPGAFLSIDTRKAAVAREALSRGAGLINDISALRYDPAMAGVVAEAGVPVVLMHMQGTLETMQVAPRYDDVISEIKSFFAERIEFARKQGIAEERIILDPGVGFGKSLEHNVEILRRIKDFKEFGRPILVGVSRKAFIAKLMTKASPPAALPSGEAALPGPENRLEGTLMAQLWAVQQGAAGLRVHDVGSTKNSLQVWDALQWT
jgi:dihydropteroate synthase